MELVKTTPVSTPEALDLLKKRQKDGELGYEQQNTLTHLEKTAKIEGKAAKALKKKLEKTDVTLSEEQVCALISLIPKNADEVRAVLVQEKTEATDDQIKSLLAVIKDGV
jgi:DNA-directed RNA polymerase subunit F